MFSTVAISHIKINCGAKKEVTRVIQDESSDEFLSVEPLRKYKNGYFSIADFLFIYVLTTCESEISSI